MIIPPHENHNGKCGFVTAFPPISRLKGIGTGTVGALNLTHDSMLRAARETVREQEKAVGHGTNDRILRSAEFQGEAAVGAGR